MDAAYQYMERAYELMYYIESKGIKWGLIPLLIRREG